MVTLLAVGADSTWLRSVLESAESLGCEVARCDSVCDAFARLGTTPDLPHFVLVDAGCCDDRSGPAFRALRAQMPRVPFIVAFEPGADRIARTLSADAVIAKPDAGEFISDRLCCVSRRGHE